MGEEQTTVPTIYDDVSDMPDKQHLHRRIIRLLLQYDQPLLRGQFRLFFAQSQLTSSPLLQQYDQYIRLQILSNELLEDILPRIRRQLSLKTERIRQREEAPPRGVIDWGRTIERGWNSTPGQPPLQFETRQRQHSMHTPENVLTVAILLAYCQTLQQTGGSIFSDEELNVQEKQILASMLERCKRELGTTFAQELYEAASQAKIPALTQQVAQQLRPGPSPYRDLLQWWHTFSHFRVGRASEERAVAFANIRNDEKADAWLYELWIALECLHLFHEEGLTQPQQITVATDLLQCTFTWQGRQFRFTYNRQPETSPHDEPMWEHAPPSRPDYTIERAEPLKISHQGRLIWQEPPVLLDAKYYLEGNDPALTHEPIKKLLGDMALLGAQHGVLFFPRIAEPADEQQITRTIRRGETRYHAGQYRPQVHLYHLEPGMPWPLLQQRLRAALDLAIAQLPERPQPICQGVLLDVDSQNAAHYTHPAQTVLCPKAHIGTGVFDLVNAERDCLKNPLLCHMIGQPITPPFVQRAVTPQQVEQRSQEIRTHNTERLRQAEQAGDDEQAEHIRTQIMTNVGHMTEQFVDTFGAPDDIKDIEERFDLLFRDHWNQHPRCFGETTRHALVSGEYVWRYYGKVNLQDWAAPAIQYCRALELELKRRLYNPCQVLYSLTRAGFTLGSVLAFYQDQQKNRANWANFVRLVAEAGSKQDQFEQQLQRLKDNRIREKRNQLAHGGAVTREAAETLRQIVVGDRNQPGVLIWLAENLRPVDR